MAKDLLAQPVDLLADQKEQPVDYQLSESIANTPSSAYNYGMSILDALTSPIDTLSNFGQIVSGGISNLVKKGDELEREYLPQSYFESGFYDAMRGVNNYLHEQPLTSMMFPTYMGEEGRGHVYGTEETGDAVAEFYQDRLGSVDAIKTTAMEDPVGLLGDASAILTGGATLLPKVGGLSNIVAKTGAAIEPLNLAKNIPQKTGLLVKESLPRDMYMSATKFSKTLSEKQRANLVETALNEGIKPTTKGLDKIEGIVNGLNDEIGALINAADESGKKVPVNAVFQTLKDLRKKVGGAKAEAPADLAKIDDAAKTFHEHMKSRGQTHMTIRELQDFKLNLYEKIFGDKLAFRSIPEKDQVRHSLAAGARSAIENEIPDIKALNEREGGLLDLKKALDRPVSRIEDLNFVGIDPAAKAGLGYTIGKMFGVPEFGTLAGLTSGVLGRPKIKAANAMTLERLRKNAQRPGLLTSDSIPRTLLQQTIQQEEKLKRKGLLN